MSVPNVETRIEAIRRRAALLGFVFEMQDDRAINGEHVGEETDPDVFLALQDYAEGILIAITSRAGGFQITLTMFHVGRAGANVVSLIARGTSR